MTSICYWISQLCGRGRRTELTEMGNKNSSEAATRIEQRMVEAMQQRARVGTCKIKSFNGIVMKFHKIDESFEKVREVFKKFDKDGSGTIDLEELKICFRELRVEFADDEVKAFHEESDMDASHGIDFKEFIVVLALVYLLGHPGQPTDGKSHLTQSKSRMGLSQLETTFETIADSFVFFDQDKDGYVTRNEMINAINEGAPGQTSEGGGDNIGVKRFEEMDWDKDGRITFKEFLFAFTGWVGIEDKDEDEGGS